MKNRHAILGIMLFISCSIATAQNGWEPQTFITGYINTIAEYSDHADTSVLGIPNDKHIGIGLAQVGLLISYKPMEQMEIKSTLVYSPWVRSWHDVVVETYASYKFNPLLKVGAGKYLTPLSPSNLYFYAPLNPSGVLPMAVSHHIFFPQSISGLQLAGETGGDLKIRYNLTYGNFYITDHLESGIIGIQGQEEIFPFSGHYEVYEGNRPESYLGGSGRVEFGYNNLFNLGLNIFEGTEYNIIRLDPATGAPASIEPAQQRSFGTDLHLNISNVKLNAEYWYAKNKTTDDAVFDIDIEYDGYYGEIIYDGDRIKPWLRYEYMNDAFTVLSDGSEVALPFNTFSGGIAYRPIFETTFKLEYRRVMVEKLEKLDELVFDSSLLQDYNFFLFSFVLSF